MHVCLALSHVQIFVTTWTVAPWDSPERIVEWIVMPSSRGSSQLRDWTHISWVSCIAGEFFTHWDTWEVPRKHSPCNYYFYIPVKIMNISDHKSSKLHYFSGIFSSQGPCVVYVCFYKTKLFTYLSFSYLILYYDDLNKERIQNDKEMF